ncbi:MAG TPA: hypothetical protein DDW89_06215, partial [Gammaproteobacteria bacterium]|nr:hypothetical protein [Gammaproteobacteria bacterium]
PKTCQDLCFSYGVVPVQVDSTDVVWREVARAWCTEQGIRRGTVVMTHGPSRAHPDASNFVEIFNLDEKRGETAASVADRSGSP